MAFPLAVLILCLLTAVPARAQNVSRAGSDAAGERTAVHAQRTGRTPQIDGRLDEAIYRQPPAVSAFIQQEPRVGAPATERTEVWVFFDDRNLYIAAHCWDSHPERMVATELRRDQSNISQGDSFVAIFDTFRDRRSGFYFQTNPLGALRDQAVTDEGNPNENWNPIWQVRSVRLADGWSTEMAIPFKSLRYGTAGRQDWGVNFRRVVKWKNETSYIVPMPPAFGTQGIYRVSLAASLVDLETPEQTINLEVKPYALSSVTTDRTASIPRNHDVDGNAGFDVKYGLTRSITADLTVNSDFAQVEEDVQQVNLTRFNLFLPEKREFFLEGAGVYVFGGGTLNPSNSNSQLSASKALRNVPIFFFSRQVGIGSREPVGVPVGTRLTGRASRYAFGATNITTEAGRTRPGEYVNFSALRVKRDFLRRSNFGMIATHRTSGESVDTPNTLIGGDLNLALRQYFTANVYAARTIDDRFGNDDMSHRAKVEYASDRYGIVVDRLGAGGGFSPDVGFMRRRDFLEHTVGGRFSPRFIGNPVVRKATWAGSVDHISDYRRTWTQNRTITGEFTLQFQSSDEIGVTHTRDYERLPAVFQISPGVLVPAGTYHASNSEVSFTMGQQRPLSGRLALNGGALYGGTKKEASYSGRVVLGPHFGVEPNISFNWVSLPFGKFNAQLAGARVILAPTARLQVSSLLQWNRSLHTLTSSARMRWEYKLGSELFLVFTDGRDIADRAVGLMNRSVAVKVTRFTRF